jgi:hypothetical protein
MMSRVGELVWLLGHASQILPFLVFAIASPSRGALEEMTTRDVRAARRTGAQMAARRRHGEIANIAVMGLYDVIVPPRERPGPSGGAQRRRIAWSNFLTLGPLAARDPLLALSPGG